jgi:hypothetical protein
MPGVEKLLRPTIIEVLDDPLTTAELGAAVLAAATSDEVKELRREAGALKEVVAHAECRASQASGAPVRRTPRSAE